MRLILKWSIFLQLDFLFYILFSNHLTSSFTFVIIKENKNPFVIIFPFYYLHCITHKFVDLSHLTVTIQLPDYSFIWRRKSVALGTSEVEIRWKITPTYPEGKYRIQHFGMRKNLWGNLEKYKGITKIFTLTRERTTWA